MIGETCLQHLRFMRWADERVLAAVSEHPPEDLAVLRHILLGEEVWLRRVLGERDVQIGALAGPGDIAGFHAAWPALHDRWIAWGEGCEDWDAPVHYVRADGVECHTPVWQIVFHVVNHGSYHRGQVSAELRSRGIAPPPTDLMVWYRSNL